MQGTQPAACPLTVKQLFNTVVWTWFAVFLCSSWSSGLSGSVSGTYNRPPTALVLTGIVTTHEVVVSPQIGGRLEKLLVDEGDAVHKDQLVAVLALDELRQEREFYWSTAKGVGVQVQEGEAALRLEQRQTHEQIAQAEATLAALESQRAASDAELANARVNLERSQRMITDGLGTAEQFDQARTTYEVAKSRVAALIKQMDAQRATVELARSNAEQVAVKQSQVAATRQQHAAADAQRAKADVRLAYAEIHAPINGFVDVRAARAGEVVNPGQAVLTLIDPDDLWIRADVEETYIDRVAVGRSPDGSAALGRDARGESVLPRRRRRLCDTERRQPHQARHQDL